MKHLLAVLLCVLTSCVVSCDDNGDDPIPVSPEVALIQSFQGTASTTQMEIMLLAEAPAVMGLSLKSAWGEYSIPGYDPSVHNSAHKWFVKTYIFDMAGQLRFSCDNTPAQSGRCSYLHNNSGGSIGGLGSYRVITALVCESPLSIYCRSKILTNGDIQK